MYQLIMADSGCEDTIPSKPPLLKMPEESDASMRARLYNSLSQSFPHSQLYKALHGEADLILGGDNFDDDDDDSLYGDHLSNSCFASLRMDRRDSDDFDDDLRSLEWLQSEDLLKNIGGEKLDKEDGFEEQKENEDIKPDISLLQGGAGHAPPHLPYQPQKHVNTKPPYSFSCLIFMAVENSPQKRLPVKDIYNWILTQFPYFQNAPTGWKNSVRHNLSLNKCFKKVDKDKGQSIGKGSLWCIDPAYRPNLLQALRKTPYHPYHQLQMTSTAPQHYGHFQSLPSGCRSVLPLTQRPIPNTVSPHLFPFLSRRLAQTSFDVDNEMKDVAQTLVSLKSSHKESADASPGTDIGPTWKYHKKAHSWNNRPRSSSPVTITHHPHSDHAYSSTRLLEDDLPSPSSSSSIDEEYDFGSDADDVESDFQSDMEWNSDDKDEVDGDLPSPKRVKASKDAPPTSASKSKKLSDTFDDEQKKIHEGANALLNLAGLFANNRSNSSGNIALEGKESGVKKVKTKKVKSVLQSEKVVKKKISKKIVEKQPQEGKKSSGRKRAGSKRKNAGSNGKYDNDEYTTFKVGKTSDGLKKASKSLKAAANGDSASNKFRTKNGANKKGQGKTKLKLSKSFSSANKNDNNNNDNCKASLIKERKKAINKKASKLDVGKKKKSNKNNLLSAKKSSKDNDVHGVSELSSTNDIKQEVDNNVTSVKAEINSYEDNESIQSDSLKNDSSLKSDVSKPVRKKELTITAAGDAPLASSHEQEAPSIKCEPSDATDEREESDVSRFLNAMGLVAASTLSKNGSSSSSSPKLGLLPMSSSTHPVPSHKSPHFTRFSKKKKVLS